MMTSSPTRPRPRVLMISDVYFPRVNGVSTSIQTFRADLAALGCESVLVAPAYPASRIDEPGIERVPSCDLPFDPEDRAMNPRRAAAAARALGPFDVVHIHTPFIAHAVGLRVAKHFDCPTVESYHTYFEQYFHHYLPWAPRRALQKVARGLSRRQCNAVDRIIAPSEPMAGVLRDYGIASPIDVIPTGLDLQHFAGGDPDRFRRTHGIAAERKLVVHVGRVAHEKNIGFIIGVVDRLRRVIPGLLLVIAGEGPARESLRREIAGFGLEGHVKFVGYLDRATSLLDCYRAADVVVFASRTETQGLVPLEAMACGKPVVSTAVLGTRSIIGPGRGAIAVPEDTGAFADAVAMLLNDGERRERVGGEALRFVEECWGSRSMARRMLDVYANLAVHRTAPAAAESDLA